MIQQKNPKERIRQSRKKKGKEKNCQKFVVNFFPKNFFILLRDILIAIVNVAKIRSINIA
jgi:hypothetical protein